MRSASRSELGVSSLDTAICHAARAPRKMTLPVRCSASTPMLDSSPAGSSEQNQARPSADPAAHADNQGFSSGCANQNPNCRTCSSTWTTWNVRPATAPVARSRCCSGARPTTRWSTSAAAMAQPSARTSPAAVAGNGGCSIIVAGPRLAVFCPIGSAIAISRGRLPLWRVECGRASGNVFSLCSVWGAAAQHGQP